MEHAIVMINQNFSLFCCAEQYSISFPDLSPSPDSDYFVCYTYPDGATTDSSAQLLTNGCVLTSQSPEYDHPCTVHAKVYASHEHTENIVEFSLDLVSPVEYLFRKFSANEFEMSDKISDKMTSALLAMSLSYYYVMGEHVEKETKMDEILSTLLNCSEHKMYMNTTRQKKDSSSEESITQFAEHFKLQSTLKYLSGGPSVGDLPVQLPKPLFPPAKKAPMKRPAIIPRTVKSLPANGNNIYQVPSNRPLSEYSVLQPVVNQDTEYMVMDNPDIDNPDVDNPDVESYSALNPINPSNNEENYCLMEQTDDRESKTLYQKPLRATKSTPFIQSSDQASNPLPPRPFSTVENVITDEVYELCESTPVEAAAAAIKKRGPPPRPPVPYRESHTLDTTKRQSDRKISGDLESSLESSLQETRISSATVKTVKVSSQDVSPLPKKKFIPFHKSKAKTVNTKR